MILIATIYIYQYELKIIDFYINNYSICSQVDENGGPFNLELSCSFQPCEERLIVKSPMVFICKKKNLLLVVIYKLDLKSGKKTR